MSTQNTRRQFLKEYQGGFGAPECWHIDVPIKGESGEHVVITRNWIDAILRGAEGGRDVLILDLRLWILD